MYLLASSNTDQGTDENHLYGHLNFENLTTVFLDIVLIIVDLSISYKSISLQTQDQFT